jgi:hypothetical protein
MQTTPKDATQWSGRAMAAAQKVSSATVQRIWKKVSVRESPGRASGEVCPVRLGVLGSGLGGHPVVR